MSKGTERGDFGRKRGRTDRRIKRGKEKEKMRAERCKMVENQREAQRG